MQGSSDELLYSLGVAAEPVGFIVSYAVVFALPDGTLNGRAERLILAGYLLYTLVGFVPWILFAPVVEVVRRWPAAARRVPRTA